ncbi:hypothetical protein FSP39_008656 [Pinctada imbricata]|uniref:Uncharacterized protein n=1 Tax=Pinctada imbricata TaxID=66713 RepID=A0AA88XKT7_PINIB|nr:hypothetical protein FSP39_008656 [Pinctada imbricata]
MAANTSRQFATVTEEEIMEIYKSLEDTESANTKKLTRLSIRIFREYLNHKGLDPDFEKLEMEELDRILAMFYVELRNSKGEMYKKTTLISYRHGIQRYLQSFRPDVDIFKGSAFKESNKAFKGVTMEMKRIGNASIEHHPVMSDKDIQKMYKYLTSSDNPFVLQHKVFIDVLIHFGCKGRQNLRGLKRSDFAIVHDEDGDMYVERVKDEEGKDEIDQSDNRMYGIKGITSHFLRSLFK